jgi:hypothetical protein
VEAELLFVTATIISRKIAFVKSFWKNIFQKIAEGRFLIKSLME